MLKIKMPPATKGRITATRGMLKACISTTKSARKAKDKAMEKYGPFTDEFYEADARYKEASSLLERLNRLLGMRIDELERPFKR